MCSFVRFVLLACLYVFVCVLRLCVLLFECVCSFVWWVVEAVHYACVFCVEMFGCLFASLFHWFVFMCLCVC